MISQSREHTIIIFNKWSKLIQVRDTSLVANLDPDFNLKFNAWIACIIKCNTPIGKYNKVS